MTARKVGNNTRRAAIPNKHQTGIGAYLRQALVPKPLGPRWQYRPQDSPTTLWLGERDSAHINGSDGQVSQPARGSVIKTAPGRRFAVTTIELSRTPRRRDFQTVPMILNDPDQSDRAVLSEVIVYGATDVPVIQLSLPSKALPDTPGGRGRSVAHPRDETIIVACADLRAEVVEALADRKQSAEISKERSS
jgi:hypothetical protein